VVVASVICVPVSGTFLNTLKFQVKDCDPTTGEPDSDVGYADEYVVSSGCYTHGTLWGNALIDTYYMEY